jgi:hypothetical protein
MTERAVSSFEHEVRDTVVKSGFTGIAATVLAVTIFSPAGLGGMIGTSLASGATDPNVASSDNPYANLPAYPSPLTTEEISDIRGQLASTTASMEFTRAATEAKIEHVRSLAMDDGLVTFTPMPSVRVPQVAEAAPQPAEPELRLTLSQPASAPAEEAAIVATPISYGGGVSFDSTTDYRGSHLELADLMFAHERF